MLRVAHIESPRSPIKLESVRLSVRKGTAPAVGSFVELKARLQPPLAPLRPGSYDFGRGLGHVLSISGYHMAVVAGVVFFAVRALLALIPGLTVSFPIRTYFVCTQPYNVVLGYT